MIDSLRMIRRDLVLGVVSRADISPSTLGNQTAASAVLEFMTQWREGATMIQENLDTVHAQANAAIQALTSADEAVRSAAQ